MTATVVMTRAALFQKKILDLTFTNLDFEDRTSFRSLISLDAQSSCFGVFH